MTKTFRDLGVDGALCDALAAEGITHPFPIQELTLPLALGGNDLIGQARTGTGKTLAFGLPLLQRLDPQTKATQALVVVPTRELCLQVYDDLKIGASLGLTSVAVYGGVGFDEQIEALRGGVHVVVGTPGRLLDHLNRRNLDLSQVTQLVLDEADEMLDMGFLPDVERLVEACTGPERHTMLFSATMPTAIVKLARRYMHHPTFTRADTEAHETAPNVTQHFFQVHRMDKPRVLARILQSPERGGVYVFVRTKHMADRLVNELESLGVASVPVHGDLRQTSREKNLERFRSGKATVLVATEVAARGLDVGGVTHVVNYDCPDDEKMYLHRIGRTARAGEAGVAVTFAEFNEVDKLNVIRKRVGAEDTPVEQVFSTSDVLTDRFDLPSERPWDHLRTAKGSSERDGRRGGDPRGKRDASDEPGGSRQDRGREARGRGDERSREREGGGDRRRGRSDGRPKSERRTEGAGGDHDARPDRARSDAGPDRRGDTSAERSRTRTRTRSRSSSARASQPAEERGGAGHERSGDAQSGQRRRARGGRPANERSTSGSSPETGTEPRAGSREGSRTRTDRDRTDRDRTDRDRTDRDRTDRDRTDRSTRGSKGRGSDERGQSSSRRGGGGRSRQNGSKQQRDTTGVEVQRRGREARGDGQPQPARRVKVEHLP